MKTRMISKRVFLACLLTCLSAVGFAQEEMQITGNVYLYQKKSKDIYIGRVLCKKCDDKIEAELSAKEIKELVARKEANPQDEDAVRELEHLYYDDSYSPFVVKWNGKFTTSCKPDMYLLFVETGNYRTTVVRVEKGKTEYKNIGIETNWKPDSDRNRKDLAKLNDKEYKYDGKYPRFPGDQNAFYDFLCKIIQRKYSSAATMSNRVEGIVEVTFSVDKDGTIRNLKCEQSPDSALADEVISFLNDMPQWQAARKPIMRQRVVLEFRTYKEALLGSLDSTFTPNEKKWIAEEMRNNARTAIVSNRLGDPHIVVVGKPYNVTSSSKGSITFVVDENLEPRKDEAEYIGDEKYITKRIIEKVSPDPDIIATSFENDKNIAYMGPDAFYKTALNAYACHQSICFSPDMIWLLICQGFSRYVNAHADELRELFVDHEGKKSLEVTTVDDLLKNRAAWPGIVDEFVKQIKDNTKDEIAETLMKGYSTTGHVERIATEITLMETMKEYFNYKVKSVCGIPSITLTGTPEDWRDLRERTNKLAKYGLDKWVKTLDPILQEFEDAANGKPNQTFWQSIVKKEQVYNLLLGGCIPGHDVIDGWILKLFPNKYGHVAEKYTDLEFGLFPILDRDNMDEMVKVDCKYNDYNIELWAGFIGAEKDTINNVIVPKIGWFVRHSNKGKDGIIVTPRGNHVDSDFLLRPDPLK